MHLLSTYYRLRRFLVNMTWGSCLVGGSALMVFRITSLNTLVVSGMIGGLIFHLASARLARIKWAARILTAGATVGGALLGMMAIVVECSVLGRNAADVDGLSCFGAIIGGLMLTMLTWMPANGVSFQRVFNDVAE